MAYGANSFVTPSTVRGYNTLTNSFTDGAFWVYNPATSSFVQTGLSQSSGGGTTPTPTPTPDPTPTPTPTPGTTFAPTVMPAAGSWTDPVTGIVWADAYAEDFKTAQPGGVGATTAQQALWEPNNGYLPAGNFYSPKVYCYERTISTTSKAGYYVSARTTRVEQDNFIIDMHRETLNGVVRPLGGTLIPKMVSDVYYTKFMRWQWRYRIKIVGTAQPYGHVFQTIRAQGTLTDANGNVLPSWPAKGEHDFPEGTVDNKVESNTHPAQSCSPLPRG